MNAEVPGRTTAEARRDVDIEEFAALCDAIDIRNTLWAAEQLLEDNRDNNVDDKELSARIASLIRLALAHQSQLIENMDSLSARRRGMRDGSDDAAHP